MDLRHSLRRLAQSPVTTAAAVLSLALGIGANTAIFSHVNAVILRPLPVRDPGQLVRLAVARPTSVLGQGPLSVAMYERLRKDQRVFSDLFAWDGDGIVNIEANGARATVGYAIVSGNYFATLGVRPLLGRLIAADDSVGVAVIDYGCWQRRFHGDAGAIGKPIRIEGRQHTVIGVTPEGFGGMKIDRHPEVTMPLRGSKTYAVDVFGRLRPGVTLEQARAQLEAAWPAILDATVPATFTAERRQAFLGLRLLVTSAATGDSFLRFRYGRPLVLLMMMAGLLLLVACANLAGLMAARTAARRREIGICIALGAGRARIVRQILTESLLLSFTGAALGLLMARWVCGLLLKSLWRGLVPLGLDATPDARVLAFTAAVAAATALLFSLWPAWNTLRSDPAAALQQGGGRSVRGGGTGLTRLLIAGQTALSLVLLSGALLFTRSLANILRADPGYQPDGVLLLQLYPQTGAESRAIPNRVAYYRELAERLSGIPGVEAVSYSHMGPVLFYEYMQPASVTSSTEPSIPAAFEAVGPGFFRLVRMRVLAGREFDWRDHENSRRVAILSESLARRLFPAGNAIGGRIDYDNRKDLEVVGVVNSASLWRPQSHEPAAVYLPLMQIPEYNSSSVDIRARGNVLPAARRVLESMGRHFALHAETLERRSAGVLASERMIALLSAFFAGLALLLVAVGLYGVTSYAVERRTAEIGLRMALGAQPGAVLSRVFSDTLRLVLAGMLVGTGAALAASRLVSGMLYGVAPDDWLTLVLACGTVLGAATLAVYAPARRAARIDPIAALRAE